MSAFLQYVQANLTALQAIFGWLTTCIGGLYVLYKFWLERREKGLQANASGETNGKDEQPARSVKKLEPVQQSRMVLLIGAALIVAGLAIAVPVTYDALTTVTVEYKVCIGEYEGGCTFAHDDRIYCILPGFPTVDDWAKKRCLRWSTATIGSHDGNKCGYTNVAVSCTKRKP
ncbi:hypothetical protein [Bradyrhizobium sp. STM 3557]|uniref:hypothetical protein n=1 Tax=Bradyrhizobium sp. STM 3557 TaxID=578920 RepID=UPI00388E76CC